MDIASHVASLNRNKTAIGKASCSLFPMDVGSFDVWYNKIS